MIDTKKLEGFATAARTQLITEVTARLNAVLAPGSTAQVEAPEAVKALNAAIREHGGGTDGRKHVAEQQAYVWFNRIIAFRFMDTNGYTTTPIVSPESGRTTGQPAVLAAAKRGEYNPDIYGNAKTVQRITGLLNGTIPSADRDGEAYGLILGAHCAHWHQAMPFMFTNAGDYSGLLMPAGLLAETSVLSRAAITLTADDCQDVEVIGWLYQYYIAEKKAQVFDSFSRGGKAGPDEIPAATQLFTPDWIVRYLVQNSVGRLWLLNHPQSKLADQMEYYIAPEGGPGEFLKIASPEELSVLDPACGSGHMLTYAFDLLYAIYEEEGYAASEIPGFILTSNLHGLEIDGRAGALAAFALTMKARARQRRFFATKTEPKVCVLSPISFTSQELDELVKKDGDRTAEEAFWNTFTHADSFGSLLKVDAATLAAARQGLVGFQPGTLDGVYIQHRAEQIVTQGSYLAKQYAVVIANPPYMGSKNQDSRLSGYLRAEYDEVKSDLFSAFFWRGLSLAKTHGQLGFMSPFVWMFISTYRNVRERFTQHETITSLIQLEYSGFEGATVPICAFTLQRGIVAGYKGGYVRLSDFVGPERQAPRALEAIQNQSRSWFYRASADGFVKIPGAPIVYWLSDAMRGAFTKGKPLGEVAEPRVGLQTGMNERFVRQWWEVSRDRSAFGCLDRAEAKRSGARWFPYNKGGDFRQWYGNQELVVNWQHDGNEVKTFGTEDGGRPRSRAQNTGTYFQPSVSWSKISSGSPAFRQYPPGFVYDVAGTSIFASSPEARLGLLAFANSQVAFEMLTALAPTLNFEVGQIASLPVVPLTDNAVLSRITTLVATSKLDWDDFETSWNFASSPLVAQGDGRSITETVEAARRLWDELAVRQRSLQEGNNASVASLYGLEREVPSETPLERVSLTRNTAFTYAGKTGPERAQLFTQDAVKEFISYAVGCMVGRYSLDEPGLILASEGETLADYLQRVPTPSFTPDADNVIPVTDGEWFEDDIVARFREFLRVSFGSEHFAENLAFVEQTLGKSLRAYFVKDFYADHVKRYKNRPIYWMFSSSGDAKGAFKALIYLHRYTPATLHTLLTSYLREFQAKLRAEIAALERSGGNAELKRATVLRKALTECEDYERDTLYPLASRNPELDLDDGVLVNYLRFGRAVVKIPAIEKNRSKVEGWTWPRHPLKSPHEVLRSAPILRGDPDTPEDGA